MLYRDHREYRKLPEEHEPLRRWLTGEAGIDSLKKWLRLFEVD